MSHSAPIIPAERMAERVRAACVQAALEAFEDASISGLCCIGAWECAVGAMRMLDVEAVLDAHRRAGSEGPDDRAAPG